VAVDRVSSGDLFAGYNFHLCFVLDTLQKMGGRQYIQNSAKHYQVVTGAIHMGVFDNSGRSKLDTVIKQRIMSIRSYRLKRVLDDSAIRRVAMDFVIQLTILICAAMAFVTIYKLTHKAVVRKRLEAFLDIHQLDKSI